MEKDVSSFRVSGFRAFLGKGLLSILCLLFFFSAPKGYFAEDRTDNFALAHRAVVHIRSTLFRHSYTDPWKQAYISRSSGTGFIIKTAEGQRVLTNAHVVSGANTIRLKRADQSADYEAKLLYIAHDCDLALLSVEDERFFEGSQNIAVGGLPSLNSPVEVIGFPIGGKRVSITRGIVSRINMSLYSHSGIDYHLIIQVDAAINPGNSGGPAMQGGKVIGIAFQAISGGENLGYLIPPQVIKRFLADVEDQKYDGYTEFGLLTLPTIHSATQRALGLGSFLASPFTGILVYDLIPGSSAAGHLEPGDILYKINGKMISENGDVEINGGLQNYSQIVDNLRVGDPVDVEILRNNKKMSLRFPSRITKIFASRRRRYEEPPSYIISGGMLFQPLDANLMRTYRSYWLKAESFEIMFRYDHFFPGKIYKEVSEDVVLTRRLADKTNIYAEEFLHHLVKAVNGEKIRGFGHFTELLKRARKEKPYLVISFHKLPYPMVFRSKDLKASEKGIFKRYGIPRSQFLSPRFQNYKTSF